MSSDVGGFEDGYHGEGGRRNKKGKWGKYQQRKDLGQWCRGKRCGARLCTKCGSEAS